MAGTGGKVVLVPKRGNTEKGRLCGEGDHESDFRYVEFEVPFET